LFCKRILKEPNDELGLFFPAYARFDTQRQPLGNGFDSGSLGFLHGIHVADTPEDLQAKQLFISTPPLIQTGLHILTLFHPTTRKAEAPKISFAIVI
jgi:hypothetical protein